MPPLVRNDIRMEKRSAGSNTQRRIHARMTRRRLRARARTSQPLWRTHPPRTAHLLDETANLQRTRPSIGLTSRSFSADTRMPIFNPQVVPTTPPLSIALQTSSIVQNSSRKEPCSKTLVPSTVSSRMERWQREHLHGGRSMEEDEVYTATCLYHSVPTPNDEINL